MGGENAKRTVKDSVFVDLFGRDETAPENFLSLYNALHGTSLTLAETELVPEMLDSVMYMSYANDVAMRVNGRIVVLIEHQSTVNENMPLRLLDYVTRIYDRIIPGRDKFKRRLIKIPLPEFYVLYNGTEDIPAVSEKRLSDAFEREDGDNSPPSLELVVKVYNINTGTGDALLQKCNILRQYTELIDLLRYSKQHAEDEHLEEPFTWAVREAAKRGILSDYLERKASEVINMFNMEYDYDADIAVQRDEAMQQGLQRGMQQGIQQGLATSIANLVQNLKLTAAQAMDALGIPQEARSQYAALLKQT